MSRSTRSPRHPPRSGHLGEELRAARPEQVHVHGRTRTPTRPRSRSRSRRSSTSRSPSVNTLNRQGKRKRTRFGYRQAQGHQARRSSRLAEGERIEIFGGPVALTAGAGRHRGAERMNERHGHPQVQADDTGPSWLSVADFVEITRTEPEKSLVRPLHKKGGRNNHGRITTRHQGGGHKRAYRVIDFRRADKDGVPAKVAHIEYDPNRTARIALLHYADGEKRYILAPTRAQAGRPHRERSGAPTSSRATACRCATSRPVRSCTRSSCGPVAAPRSPARPAPASSWWPRKARTRSCGCRPARSATSTCAAAPPSARSATPSSRTSTGARPAACAGRASARPSAVSR